MAKTSNPKAKPQEAPSPPPAKENPRPGADAAAGQALPELKPVPPQAAEDLDTAFALMLADLNSRSILLANRKAMLYEDTLRLAKDPGYEALEGLESDLGRLYKAALTLERDPEVIRRNTMATILMTLSPLIVGIQDILDTPGFPLWKVGMEGLVLTTEMLGSSQYLEAAKLISASEYELSLWGAERRVGDLLVFRSGSAEDLVRDHAVVAEFFDRLRGDAYPHEQRPVIFFFVSLIIAIISYSLIRKRAA